MGSCGHTWPAQISSRARKGGGTGCPFCAGTKVLKGFNDLATCNQKLSSEWHPRKNGVQGPSEVTKSSTQKAWWLGPCGHEWNAEIKSRNNGRGCPFCSGNAVLAGFNDIATTHPHVAIQISPTSPIQPQEVSFGSHKKLIWLGTCGHEWDAAVVEKVNGSSCPFCSGHRLLVGFNDLQTKFPEVALEWDLQLNAGIKPSEVSYGSQANAWWHSKRCGHTWSAAIYRRAGSGHGCTVCAGKVVQPGINDIATVFPQLIAEWNTVRNPKGPQELTWGTKTKVWFICPLGHDWDTVPSTRVARNLGCPYCSRRKLLSGFNDFASVCPEAASEWDAELNGTESPAGFLPGSQRKFWFRCLKNHTWLASLFSRYHNASGCPTCAVTGFDPKAPGTIYLLKHDRLASYKLGITNTNTKVDRVRQFVSRGWAPVSLWTFDTGNSAYEIEQRFFIWLRGEVGLKPSCSPSDLQGMSGYTETFTVGVIKESALKMKVESLIGTDG